MTINSVPHANYDNITALNTLIDALAQYGYEDSTYCNDTAPSIAKYEDSETYRQIYVDYSDPSLRECDLPEFSINYYENGDYVSSVDFNTVEEVIEHVTGRI